MSDAENRFQAARARGIRARDEAHAARVGGGTNESSSIGGHAIEGPVLGGSPYDYNDSRANRTPGASDVTAFGQLGYQNIWVAEREYALQHASSDGYPFDTVSVPPGLNRTLTQAEADILNARYGGGQP